MEHVKLFFNSVERCLEYASQPVPDFVTRDSRKDWDSDWAGSKDYDHALQIAREGLDLEKIHATMGELSIGVKQQELFYDVTGSYVDIGRYLEGEPENMINFQESQENRFIDVKFLFSENAGVSSETFTNKVIVLASIVDRLESIGFRVRLIACCRCKQDNVSKKFKFDMDVIVKDYKENLSIGQVSGCVNASFFRRIMFAIIEIIHAEREYDAAEYGYGQSCGWRDDDKGNDVLLIGRNGDPYNFKDRSNLKNVVDQIMRQYES